MRILITGSSGHVGAAIAARLAESHETVGFDLVPGPYTTHLGSVADRALVSSVVEGVDAIVHTASLHAPDLGRASRGSFAWTNVEGTHNLLWAAAERRVRRLVYSSSTSVYGYALVPRDGAVWVTEELAPQPRDVYDETKLAAEALCREATLAGRVPCVGLRFARCFPEPTHRTAAYRLYRGVDVRDVAEAHRLALVGSFETFEVFNISARSPFSRNDCVQLFSDARSVIRARCPGLVEAFADRGWPLPTSIDRVYTIDKAGVRLGYRPRYNVWEYVADTRS